MERVVQLYGVSDLNGRTDLNTDGPEVEGGLFTEELVIRYALLFLKMQLIGGVHFQERDSWGSCPSRAGPFLKMCLYGKISCLHRILFREESCAETVLGVGPCGPFSPRSLHCPPDRHTHICLTREICRKGVVNSICPRTLCVLLSRNGLLR
jgi:hypothetical protein